MIIYFILAIIGAAIMVSLRKSELPPIVDLGIFAAIGGAAFLIFGGSWLWIVGFAVTYRLALNDIIVDLMKRRKYGTGIGPALAKAFGIKPQVAVIAYFGAAVLVSVIYHFSR